ncbi:MAG: hypothetical protein LQ343_003056 [Gyalolechia ehrenbergii]|nr:MAG: hypothetical protein LQ343_003056 [Gyalolechia ehrenbergii]
MSRAVPSYVLRSLPFRIHNRQAPKLHSAIFFREARHSSTVRSSTGRKLSITRGTPATISDCDCNIQLPKGLEIDRTRPLINTVASYNQHVVIATGKNDWESRIENEVGVGDMARTLKDMTKSSGEWFDPNYSTLISNSSFPVNIESRNHGGDSPQIPSDNSSVKSGSASDPQPGDQAEVNTTSTSIRLFPHFLHFSGVDNSSTHQNHLASTYLGDQTLLSDPPLHPPPSFSAPQPITKPTILICSHGGRDARCGVLGPLLYDKFLQHAPERTVEVGMISHVGGHAFAGNVIIYMPPSYLLSSNTAPDEREAYASPLAGMGIWYGRVEPRHVQTILEETVEKGNIIGELWRGGLDVGVTRDGVEDWRARTARPRIMRIPSDILEQDGTDIEEGDFREQMMDITQRVEMMGRRARERLQRRRSESA